MDFSQNHRSHSRPGFTLVEIMVVIVIILLMLGMAIPVLHVITGSQSEAGATNMIAAMLSRARSDAIGLQKPVGVAFIYNPNTQVETMAEVELPLCTQFTPAMTVAPGTCVYVVSGSRSYYFVSTSTTITNRASAPTASQNTGAGAFWQAVAGPPVEMRPETDLQPLPAGIAAQTLCNCQYSSGASPTRLTDGYLSVGVILFDGQGRLTSLPYGIAASSRLATSSGLTQGYPLPGQGITIPGSTTQYGMMSQFGLVVFQRNEFVGQNFSANDPAYFVTNSGQQSAYSSSTGGPSQAQEETWLDENATPLLINRYPGTLIRGE